MALFRERKLYFMDVSFFHKTIYLFKFKFFCFINNILNNTK
jgi:hypothetical protein